MHFAWSFLFRHLLFIFIHFQTFRWSFLHCNGWVRGYKGADMHGNGYSGDTAAFWGLSMRTVTNIHLSTSFFSVQWTNTSSNNPSQDAALKPTRQIVSMCLWIRNRVIIRNCRPAKMGHMMQPSGEPAAPGMGWTVKIPRIWSSNCCGRILRKGNPAVRDDFWCSSWTLKGLETHHLAEWTWQMFERYECFIYFFRRF